MILLLTGCINPAGMSYTTLINPEERKKQYVDAIHFYLSKTKRFFLFSFVIVFMMKSNLEGWKFYVFMVTKTKHEEKVTENVKLLSMPFKTPN